MIKNTFNHYSLICPYCGNEDYKVREIFFHASEDEELDVTCKECKKEFVASYSTTASYAGFVK